MESKLIMVKKNVIYNGPAVFWNSRAMKETFPRLQKMALDLYTIPAMSDESERVFSSTGIMVRPHRSKLSIMTIAASQFLSSWSKEGIVTFQSFEKMKDRLQHMETIQIDE